MFKNDYFSIFLLFSHAHSLWHDLQKYKRFFSLWELYMFTLSVRKRVVITSNSAILRQWLSRLSPCVSALFSASLSQGPACGKDLMRTSLSERWTQAVLLCPHGCPHPSLWGTEGGAVCWPALAEDSRQGESCSGLCRITWRARSACAVLLTEVIL